MKIVTKNQEITVGNWDTTSTGRVLSECTNVTKKDFLVGGGEGGLIAGITIIVLLLAFSRLQEHLEKQRRKK